MKIKRNDFMKILVKCDQDWDLPMIGPRLDRDWAEIGPRLDRDWTKIGPRLDHVSYITKIGP